MDITASDYLLASFELWGAVACLFIAFYTQRAKIIFPAGANYMTAMLIISAVMMFSDVVSFTSNGKETVYAFYENRISNFLCFTLAYVCLHLFSSYIVCFIKTDIPTKVGEYFVKDFAVFGILAVIINIFKPFYYYFDETNNYQRGEYFELGQILTIIPFFVVAFMIIHNRKQIGRNGFIAFISYVTFPAISILLTAGQYTRVSRLNIGISLALYFMVAIIISDQRRSIFEQRKAILNQEREINEMQIRLVISQIQPHLAIHRLAAHLRYSPCHVRHLHCHPTYLRHSHRDVPLAGIGVQFYVQLFSGHAHSYRVAPLLYLHVLLVRQCFFKHIAIATRHIYCVAPFEGHTIRFRHLRSTESHHSAR